MVEGESGGHGLPEGQWQGAGGGGGRVLLLLIVVTSTDTTAMMMTLVIFEYSLCAQAEQATQ